MSLTFHWFLPTNGDGRHVVGGGHGVATGSAGGTGPPTIAYLGQIARAAEDLGFDGGAHPDRRLVRGRLADHRDAQPAHRAAEVPGRLPARLRSRRRWPRRWRPPSSGSPAAGCCSTWSPAARATSSAPTATSSTRTPATRRTGEFLHIVRALWRGETVDLHGEHLQVEERRRWPGVPDPVPRGLLRRLLARGRRRSPREHADVYLTWGEPPAAGRGEDRLDPRAAAAERGRELRFGIRLHVITRDTAEEAWAEADRLLDGFDPADDRDRPGGAGAAASPRGSSGCSPCTAASTDGPGDRTRTCGPASAWSAAARAPRWSAATTRSPTGSTSTTRSGIDEFILSGYPHLEEAYWFGEGVLPELARRGLWNPPDGHVAETGPVSVPFAGVAR